MSKYSPCSIDGCSRPHLARGWCATHYMRWKKHGTTDLLPKQPRPLTAKRRVSTKGYIVGSLHKQEHVAIAERVLGKALPAGACVHHTNEVKSDNRNENLVICPSNAYHKLLHQRMNALAVSGNANWRKCKYCHQYDSTDRLKIIEKNAYHKRCAADYAYRKRHET